MGSILLGAGYKSQYHTEGCGNNFSGSHVTNVRDTREKYKGTEEQKNKEQGTEEVNSRIQVMNYEV